MPARFAASILCSASGVASVMINLGCTGSVRFAFGLVGRFVRVLLLGALVLIFPHRIIQVRDLLSVLVLPHRIFVRGAPFGLNRTHGSGHGCDGGGLEIAGRTNESAPKIGRHNPLCVV